MYVCMYIHTYVHGAINEIFKCNGHFFLNCDKRGLSFKVFTRLYIFVHVKGVINHFLQYTLKVSMLSG